METPVVLFSIGDNGVAVLRINRPEVLNAFDDRVIEALITHLDTCHTDPQVKVLLLCSEGKHFSSGADLSWMKRMAASSHQENLNDAERLAYLMQRLNTLAKPTLCLIQGNAYGGAIGLAACCDIVIATESSLFCLSEVKIGLIPAVISPYVVRAIGERQARRYFLTAEPFSALQAATFGLVHEIVATPELFHESYSKIIGHLQQNSPKAIHAAKELIASVSQQTIDDVLIQDTVMRIADIRVSDEGQEGLSAFLQKRSPSWKQE